MTQAHEYKRRLFEILKREAFFREKVVLSSGKHSDYYLDARRVTLSAEGSFLAAHVVLDAVKSFHVDAIGGPTLGADPMVGAIALLSFHQERPVNTFIIRKAPKAHGKQQQIEGPLLKPKDKVVVVDDVATTGKAFLQALDVLAKEGIDVVRAVCLVDRDEGARQALAQRQCELISIFNINEFL